MSSFPADGAELERLRSLTGIKWSRDGGESEDEEAGKTESPGSDL